MAFTLWIKAPCSTSGHEARLLQHDLQFHLPLFVDGGRYARGVLRSALAELRVSPSVPSGLAAFHRRGVPASNELLAFFGRLFKESFNLRSAAGRTGLGCPYLRIYTPSHSIGANIGRLARPRPSPLRRPRAFTRHFGRTLSRCSSDAIAPPRLRRLSAASGHVIWRGLRGERVGTHLQTIKLKNDADPAAIHAFTFESKKTPPKLLVCLTGLRTLYHSTALHRREDDEGTRHRQRHPRLAQSSGLFCFQICRLTRIPRSRAYD